MGVMDSLGLTLDISSFEKRLRIQKIVYMLQLHPEFKPYLNYSYNLFIRGPYSPDLAWLYYHIPKDITPARIDVSKKALTYGRIIASWDNDLLEVASTLIETMKINRGCPDEEIIDIVTDLKPYFKRNDIRDALRKVKEIKRLFGLVF
mgnify:CR=1 FL=1